MKGHAKWLFAVLFVLTGVLFAPTMQTEVQAAARLNYTSLKLKQGSTKKLKLKDSSAKVQWSSNKPNVVSVNKKGKITAVKGGKATITAKTKKKVFRCKVTVTGFNKSSLTLSKGTKYTLKVKNARVISWSSKKEAIAKVTKKGVVKAKKAGKTVIKCKTSNGTIKCTVYVAALNATYLRQVIGSQYQLSVNNTGDECHWSSANDGIATVDENGLVTITGYVGTTTITCKTGNAVLTCTVKAISPGNITTPISSLPMSSKEDILEVTVESYPGMRTYTVYRQSADVNKTSGDNGVYSDYMQDHGCAACAVSTVLSGYTEYKLGPIDMTERVERNLFGADWAKNYSKAQKNQMPVSLYGITKILDSYGVSNEYVRAYDQMEALQQITNHLRTGNAVIIEVRKKGSDNKWANSYHTMVLLGMTDNGYAIVADSADRAEYFGEQRRIKYASVYELLGYMFSCTNTTSTSTYFSKTSGGGYILVNPE